MFGTFVECIQSVFPSLGAALRLVFAWFSDLYCGDPEPPRSPEGLRLGSHRRPGHTDRHGHNLETPPGGTCSALYRTEHSERKAPKSGIPGLYRSPLQVSFRFCKTYFLQIDLLAGIIRQNRCSSVPIPGPFRVIRVHCWVGKRKRPLTLGEVSIFCFEKLLTPSTSVVACLSFFVRCSQAESEVKAITADIELNVGP